MLKKHIWSQFTEEAIFFYFPAIWSHVKENENNSLKFKISKFRKSNFVRVLETKIIGYWVLEKFGKFRSYLWEE